jgi:transcriptional regulator with XRE-family HTH domain
MSADGGDESGATRPAPAFAGLAETRCQDSARMKHTGRYRDRIVERLRDVIEAQGTSVAAAEKKLKRGRGYVADALRGDKKLSVEVIIEVLEAVGVPPEEFFERPMTPPLWRSKIAEAGASHLALAETLPASMRDASPLVQALVLLLANKGLLSVDELQEVQHAVAPGVVSGSGGGPAGTPKR